MRQTTTRISNDALGQFCLQTISFSPAATTAHFSSCARPLYLFPAKTAYANMPVSQRTFWLVMLVLAGVFPVILIKALFHSGQKSPDAALVPVGSLERFRRSTRALTPVSKR